jgi:hypothetical protein
MMMQEPHEEPIRWWLRLSDTAPTLLQEKKQVLRTAFNTLKLVLIHMQAAHR